MTGIQRTEILCNGKVKRYRLTNGWFVDGTDCRGHQYHGYRYSIWAPGMGDGGIAGFRGGFSMLKDAVNTALAMKPA